MALIRNFFSIMYKAFRLVFFTAFLISLSLPSLANRNRIDSLLKVIGHMQPNEGKARSLYQLSKDFLRVSGDSSVMYAKQAVALCKKLGIRKWEAESYGILGANEKNQGNYQAALTYHLKGLHIKEELNDEVGLATSYNDIGIVYKKLKRWKEALQYYRLANQLHVKINETKHIALTYNNMGTVYNELQQWDSAMYAYNQALIMAEKLQDPYTLSVVLSNLGDIHFQHKRYKDALATFQRCLVYDKQNEDKYGMLMSYMQIARVYAEMQQYNIATLYIDSSDKIAVLEDLNRERIDVLSVKASIEERKNNYSKALVYYRLADSIKDVLLTEETARQISELQTKYETSKKEQQITAQKAEIVKKNYIIGGIGSLLFLGGMLGFSSYRRYKLKQQSRLQAAVMHQQELASKAVIEAEEQERKRIAGDLHDGVGQLMSAARMNLSLVNSELDFNNQEQKEAFDKALALVDESCKEVRAVSHNIMPNALLKAGLATAIRDFINKIDARVLKVNLYTEGINDRLPTDKETVLYRVIQECINNVIKHSGATLLDISIIKDEEGISVTIEDNGRGFDVSDKSKFEGIGLKNIQTRVNYLKGTVEWESTINKGTLVIIHVP